MVYVKIMTNQIKLSTDMKILKPQMITSNANLNSTINVNKINKWLNERMERYDDDKVKPEYIDNDITLELFSHANLNHDYYSQFYGKEDDIDVKNSDNVTIGVIDLNREAKNEMDEETKVREKYIQKFTNGNKILIPTNTYRFYANNLLRELINYCIKCDAKFGKNYIVNERMKNRFYEFCYNNTYANTI